MQFLIALAVYIVATAALALLAPKPPQPKPAAFEEFDFAQWEEGTEQAVFFGDCWTSDWFVLWYGNYRTTKVKSSGGK
jgi:hypothetical protein